MNVVMLAKKYICENSEPGLHVCLFPEIGKACVMFVPVRTPYF